MADSGGLEPQPRRASLLSKQDQRACLIHYPFSIVAASHKGRASRFIRGVLRAIAHDVYTTQYCGTVGFDPYAAYSYLKDVGGWDGFFSPHQ